jgi:hypothetical protein
MRFDDFKSELGRAADCVPVPSEVLQKYAGRLPPALLEEWRQYGWCGYGDGIIWFEDPRPFEDLITEWKGADAEHIVFARTAFANLFTLKDGKIFAIQTQFKECSPLVHDIDFFGSYTLRSKDFMKDFAHKKLFDAAKRQLGALHHDECYAFVPALALGGEARLENIRKVKLLEYLDLLAQLD